MPSSFFPPVSESDEQGFLGWTPDLPEALVVDAYANGIFPWPQSEKEILWFSPPERGVLEFSKYKPNRSFKRALEKRPDNLEFKRDTQFVSVIEACRDQARPGQTGTWISQMIVDTYTKLHKKGLIHSFEVFENGSLIGGLYGVFVGAYFSAESMFFHKTNASKWALDYCIRYLESVGHDWMDIQMLTPVTESIGCEYISGDDFLKKIELYGQKKIPWEVPGDL